MLRYGFSRFCVTPAPDCRVSLAGYFNKRWQEGKIDDIYVYAMLVADEHEVVALCQADSVSVPLPLAERIRSGCRDIVGLKPENIVVCATHSHTCPALMQGDLPIDCSVDDDSKQVATDTGSNPAYDNFLVEQAVKAIHAAYADLRPSQAYYGECEDSRWAYCRRYWMKDNTVVTNPRRQDPNIAKAEGPIDPRIGIFGLKNEDGSWRFLMANISNHPDTVEGNLVCADWCGVVRSVLEKELPGCLTMSLTAPQGNVNHFNVYGPEQQSGYERITRRMGEGYAESVLAALPKMRKLADGPLKALHLSPKVPARQVAEEEIERAREHAAKYEFDENMTLTSEDLAKGAPHALKFFADQLLSIVDDNSERELPVWGWKLGELYLISLPGEPFIEHGMYIREDLLQRKPCLITALAMSRLGYIPNRYNFGRGGYETTVLGSPTCIEAGNLLRETAAELIAKLG
ncbi:MAG: hypothetical protein GX946_06630 [Oligosphaeraceae bacterium]|nr:hypothetical protein [Oligosphaeraceae bacterium]